MTEIIVVRTADGHIKLTRQQLDSLREFMKGRHMDKDKIIATLDATDTDPKLKLISELKVCLLADARDGGLNEASRKRAWQMVHELGQLLCKP